MEYQIEKHIVIKLTYAEAADLLQELQTYDEEQTNNLASVLRRILELTK